VDRRASSRQRRKAAAPRKRASEVRFEENRELLEAFLATIAALGRLPEADECAQAAEVMARFGSLKRATFVVAGGRSIPRPGPSLACPWRADLVPPPAIHHPPPERSDERAGLLNETATIGTREGWLRCLEGKGFAIRRHRVIRRVAEKVGDE
jgi:hypothetical protein